MSKKLRNILISVISLILAVGGIFLTLKLSDDGGEGEARKFAEDYMIAAKNGEDVFDYILLTDGFIDVFDFEYLSTIEVVEEKKTLTRSKDLYNYIKDTDGFEYNSLEEYLKAAREEFNSKKFEVLTDEDDVVKAWVKGEYSREFTFLYNVTIANGLGQKIYKKAEITVLGGDATQEGEVMITDISIR